MPARFEDTYQFLFERFVDHEVDHRLRDAEVAGGDALVEASDALRGVNPLHALRHGHFGLGVVVQLEAGLDEPDRIGEGGRYESGTRCTHDVHQR